jgi:hypothetical protein
MTMLAVPIALHSSVDAKAIPTDARSVVGAVRAAAKAKDYVALRRLMVSDFTWSFGGDGDAKQAIEAWRRDPGALKELYRVTGLQCSFRSSVNDIQCPPNAGFHYRAGFTKTDSGWRMSYFVAGD